MLQLRASLELSEGLMHEFCLSHSQEQIRSKLPKYHEPKQHRPLLSAPQPFNTSGIIAPPILRPGMPPPPSSVPVPMPVNIIRPGMGPPMMDGRPPFQPPPVGQMPPPV